MRFKRYAKNAFGRDFVIGDVHGCFDQVVEGMRKVGFDMRRDRLFSVGDTIDRGPGSERSRAFLECDFVHAIRGNHEDMFLDIYRDGAPSQGDLRAMLSTRTAVGNGMAWWLDMTEEWQAAAIERFASLPIAMEVETARGTVGLVHAEVPRGMDWAVFVSKVEAGDPKTIKSALWGRSRIGTDSDGVAGVGRIYCGHTPINAPLQAGNVYYLDTGAVFGVLNGMDGGRGRLTMAELDVGTRVMAPPPPADGMVDARQGGDKSRPFGAYAK